MAGRWIRAIRPIGRGEASLPLASDGRIDFLALIRVGGGGRLPGANQLKAQRSLAENKAV
jgi:hypothetical protein